MRMNASPTKSPRHRDLDRKHPTEFFGSDRRRHARQYRINGAPPKVLDPNRSFWQRVWRFLLWEVW